MKARIVLSFCFLLLALGACETDYRGIGTSPSVGADDDPIASATSPLVAPPPCAIWLAHSDEASAEEASTVRHPDLVQYTLAGGLSCAWAFQLTALVWPERSFIRPWR